MTNVNPCYKIMQVQALTFCNPLPGATACSDLMRSPCAPGDAPALSDVPQLRALYDEADAALDEMDVFVGVCEVHLRQCLVADTIPSAELTRAIAVSKIRAVETCIELCFRLKQEVGSYALMGRVGVHTPHFHTFGVGLAVFPITAVVDWSICTILPLFRHLVL